MISHPDDKVYYVNKLEDDQSVFETYVVSPLETDSSESGDNCTEEPKILQTISFVFCRYEIHTRAIIKVIKICWVWPSVNLVTHVQAR